MYKVVLNEFNQGLLWGQAHNDGSLDGFLGFIDLQIGSFASVLVSGVDLNSLSVSLAMNNKILTGGLSGNNLTFANYINNNAGVAAFYFGPSFITGNLASALQSAAPTRNAFPIFAADNNMFSLNHGLSTHLRNHRHFKYRMNVQTSNLFSTLEPRD